MYKFSKIKTNVKEKIPVISDYLSGISELSAAYLFGSYARGEQDHASDIDIALLFHENFSSEKMDEMELAIWKKLTEIMKTDEIDLLVMNRIPLSIQFEIIKSGKIICNNDNDHRIQFELIASAKFWDFKRVKDEYDKYSIQRMKSNYAPE